MTPQRRTLAGGLVLALVATLGSAGPAGAATRVHPGNFTGFGFDTCLTPDQATMDAWLTTSPYFAVGVYTSGMNRFCADQPNLTPEWVATQSAQGWRILPITLGRQASCSTVTRYDAAERISSDPTDDFALARAQGIEESAGSVAAAQALGIAAGSTLWLDIEHYDTSNARCNNSTLAFMAAWTTATRDAGYRSGVYSSASSGIAALDRAQAADPTYPIPDYIWFGWGNRRADSEIDPAWVRPTSWQPHRRIHQYHLDTTQTFGGITMTIDKNWLDVGRGSVPGRAAAHCRVPIDFPRYRLLRPGAVDDRVRAAKCFLRQRGFFRGRLTPTFIPRLARSVSRYQTSRGLPVTGTMTRRTWVQMLAEGRTPVVKIGSGADAVRRLQRALNAAADPRLPITGVVDAATSSAVRDYQRARGLRATGVVADDTWAELLAGRR